MPSLNPDSLKIGFVILVATRKPAIQAFQRKVGYGESSKWTHVAGSIGGYDAVEAAVPKSRVVNLQKEYIDTPAASPNAWRWGLRAGGEAILKEDRFRGKLLAWR